LEFVSVEKTTRGAHSELRRSLFREGRTVSLFLLSVSEIVKMKLLLLEPSQLGSEINSATNRLDLDRQKLTLTLPLLFARLLPSPPSFVSSVDAFFTMQTNKPPPPPGRPTIAQRVSAIQLATRSHSSPKGKVMARGEAMILTKEDKPKSAMHSMITTCQVDEMEEESRFSKSSRPRFMRWKNNDKYPRSEKDDGK
jgi:hypothetical protein